MRTLYIIISLFFVMGMFACTNDKGNYDYLELNKITLSGLIDKYSVDQYDTLKIDDLELNFSVEENADLAFEWVIKTRNKDIMRVVSTERNCNGYITEAPGGYDAWLCVTDRTNDLKYYQDFTVEVETPYVNGLYVLSEAIDGTAVLSMQRRDKPDAPLMFDIFEINNPGLGKLGKKPVQICYDEMSNWCVNVVCREGERKLLRIDPQDLKLQQYWDESSIGEGYTGTFVPEYFCNDMGSGMVLSEGRLFLFNYSGNSTLYYPVEGYDFSWVGTNPTAVNEYYYAYDEISQTFKKLEKKNNPLLFSQVSTLEELNTTGQTYLAAGTVNFDSYDKIQYPVLYDPATGMEHYYEIHIGGDYDYETWEYITYFNYSEKMVRPATLDKDGVCLLSDASYWYASKGNKVVRYFFSATSVIQDWITGLKGTVTSMVFDDYQERIFVAAYDGTKSYIYEISAVNPGEQLNEPMELEGKVVSMCKVGDWKY